MSDSFWIKLHAASSHFPIALLLVAALCELLMLALRQVDTRRRLHFTSTVCLTIGALGAWGTVITGMVMTKGVMWGGGNLLRHHQFVWPAFLLMSGAAAWRSVTSADPKPWICWSQFLLVVAAAACVAVAGYWGGELSFAE